MSAELIVVGLFAGATSWLVCFLVSGVHKTTKLGKDDHTNDKPQRMHYHEVSRLGGVGVAIGLGVCAVLAFPEGSSAAGRVTYPLILRLFRHFLHPNPLMWLNRYTRLLVLENVLDLELYRRK